MAESNRPGKQAPVQRVPEEHPEDFSPTLVCVSRVSWEPAYSAGKQRSAGRQSPVGGSQNTGAPRSHAPLEEAREHPWHENEQWSLPCVAANRASLAPKVGGHVRRSASNPVKGGPHRCSAHIRSDRS